MNLYLLVFVGDILDEHGQVSLQVGAWSEKVGDDDDLPHAPGDQEVGGLLETGTPKFKEGRLDHRVIARTRELRCRRADGLVGRFDSGAVGEDDDPGSHALLM